MTTTPPSTTDAGSRAGGSEAAGDRTLGSRLFAIITVIERELARLPEPNAEEYETLVELRAFWAELLALLVTDPVPKLRECPTCKHLGIASASRCGYCWTKLTAPDDEPPADSPRAPVRPRDAVRLLPPPTLVVHAGLDDESAAICRGTD